MVMQRFHCTYIPHYMMFYWLTFHKNSIETISTYNWIALLIIFFHFLRTSRSIPELLNIHDMIK